MPVHWLKDPSARPDNSHSTQRDEAAAAALGLASRAGSATVGSGRRRSELASTFKSLGGAFKGIAKDMASVSKSQLKTLVGVGQLGGGPGGGRF